MDTFKTADINNSMRTAITNGLTVQKELASLTESQLKLAQSQMASSFDAYRSAFAASQNAAQAMSKVWLDSFKVETAV